MKCPEVMEWMHRYIDGDLNEEESDTMFQHLGACSDCAEQFEWLKMLSAKLEDLPKVTPNYSLVDSILPQLDAIDRARQEESHVVEVIPGMIPATTHDTEFNHKSRRLQTSRRKRAYVSGALGLAAALILGVFIYQHEPLTISDAEIALSPQEASTSSDNSSPAANKGSTSDSANISGSSADRADTDTGTNTKEDDAGSPEPLTTQDDVNLGPSDSSGNSLNDKGNTADSRDQKTIAPVPSLPSDNTGNKPSKPYDAAPGAGSGSNSSSQKLPAANVETDGSSPNAGSNQDKPTEPEAAPLESSMIAPADSSMMGIARFADVHEWTSPDGKYTVDRQNEVLSLYQLNESVERKLISEVSIDGEWITGYWSEDGKEFKYEIVKDGVSSIHTITP